MLKKIIIGVITTALATLALAGYTAKIDAAKAVTKCESIESQIQDIRTDVRDIKKYLMENR